MVALSIIAAAGWQGPRALYPSSTRCRQHRRRGRAIWHCSPWCPSRRRRTSCSPLFDNIMSGALRGHRTPLAILLTIDQQRPDAAQPACWSRFLRLRAPWGPAALGTGLGAERGPAAHHRAPGLRPTATRAPPSQPSRRAAPAPHTARSAGGTRR